MGRVIRSEAQLAEILARPGFKVASQFGGEVVNTSTSGGVRSRATQRPDFVQAAQPDRCTSGGDPSEPSAPLTLSTPGAQPPSLGAGSPPAASPGTLYALVALCRAVGLPEPIPEYRFHDKRKWRFDYAWPMRKVALEVEGGIWTGGRHTRGAGALADLEKYSEAAIAGWRVIYCVPGDLATVGLERVRRAIG